MNKATKIVLWVGGGITALAVLGAATGGHSSPTASTSTPAPTAAPTPQPTPNPTQEPTAAPAVVTPKSETCFRIFEMSNDQAQTVFQIKATGPDAELACSSADSLDGQQFNGLTVSVATVDHLASDASFNCSKHMDGINVTVRVYDNGTALSRAAANGFCQGGSSGTTGA